MKKLHPVHWQVETCAPEGFYAFAWGGGLDEPVRTNGFSKKEEAIADLRSRLAKVGRCLEGER